MTRYDGKTTRRKLKKLRLDEISLVDRPAHGPARVAILKRAADPVAVQKRLAMTDAVDGHTHTIVMVAGYGDQLAELKAGRTSYADDHAHDWILDAAGNVVIGEAEGHTHQVAMLVKQADLDLLPEPGALAPRTEKGDATASETHAADVGTEIIKMTPEEQAAINKAAEEKLVAEKARADRAEAVVALSPEQRAHFDALDTAGQDEFLKAADKDAIVKNAQASDPVVHTDLDGNQYRKSCDPTVLRLVKSNDELRKSAARAEKLAKRAEFVKRAGEELAHVTGDAEAKADLLEAVASLPTEKQAPVLAILKSKDAGMQKAFETVGTSDDGNGEGASAESKLNAIAKSIRDQNPKLTPEQAYVRALETPEGAELANSLR